MKQGWFSRYFDVLFAHPILEKVDKRLNILYLETFNHRFVSNDFIVSDDYLVGNGNIY